jgi:hypothetical protein
MPTRVPSLLMRPMSSLLASWIVVAIALIVAQMLVVLHAAADRADDLRWTDRMESAGER